MTQEEKRSWSQFEERYIKLEPEIEKDLVLTQWQTGTWFGKMGLSFAVVEEGGRPTNKQFTTTSRRLVAALKPVLQKAEGENREAIRLNLTRIGDGFDTAYKVVERPLVEEEVVSDE